MATLNLIDLMRKRKSEIYAEGVTQPVAGLEQKIWSDEIIFGGEANRQFEKYSYINKELVTTKGNVVTVSVRGPKLTFIDTAIDYSGTSAGKRKFTRMDNLSDKTITFANTDYKNIGIQIADKDILNERVDLIENAKAELTGYITDKPDTGLATAYQDPLVTQRLWGTATATSVSTLAAGGIMTPTLFANTVNLIEKSNFIPYVAFLSPTQVNQLRVDSQFTNASELGNDSVVKTGLITNYLGCDIIQTTNAPAYSATQQDVNETHITTGKWSVAGNTGIILGKTRAGQICAGGSFWKLLPKLKMTHDDVSACSNFLLDMCQKSSILQPLAVALVKTTLV